MRGRLARGGNGLFVALLHCNNTAMNRFAIRRAKGAWLAAAVILAAGGFIIQPAGAATQCGKASWYEHTSRTASGERGDPNGFTAAHRSLPFGTRVQVVNLQNGRSVSVRVNDRGPFVGGRVIDVSRAAAEELGFRNRGVARVKVVTGNDGGDC